MDKENIRKESGITLIALVITIIVMLILVAVTINLAIQGGLFNYAQTAKEGTIEARDKEQELANLESGLGYNGLIDKYVEKYTAYTVGQTVTIADQNFYVIEDSNEYTSTVKLLAAKNVDTREEIVVAGSSPLTTSLEKNPNYNKQSDGTLTIAFDSTSPYTNDYYAEGCTIRGLVDSYVGELGVTVEEGRLMTLGEVVALGGDAENGNTENCPSFINTTPYWLATPSEYHSLSVWDVYGYPKYLQDGGLNDGGIRVGRSFDYGLRPVIVILKTNIPEQP